MNPDPNPDPSFQIKALKTLEKVLKQAHIPYILACHLQIDVDPVPDPSYHLDADTDFNLIADADLDADPDYQNDADPDPQHCLPERCSVLQSYGGSWVIEHEQ